MKHKIILYTPFFICFTLMMSCSTLYNFKKDEKLFNSSAVVTKYKAVADMNDAYFVIKENNFFEFYRQLFDTVKNTNYPGKYIKKGDTLYLHFYNKKANKMLGSKALINPNKKEIIFFDNSLGKKRKLIFN